MCDQSSAQKKSSEEEIGLRLEFTVKIKEEAYGNNDCGIYSE